MKQANESLLFERFIVSKENEKAYLLAKEFGDGFSGWANPNIIFGPSGEGKTHLLYAIVNQLLTHGIPLGEIKVVCASDLSHHRFYLSGSERFIFIDNLSAIPDREGAASELPYRAIKGILTSVKVFLFAVDSPDSSLKNRLRRIFPSANLAEIQPSSFELKMRMAEASASGIPPSILREIARRSSSIREVEGWIIHYDACQKLGEPFSLGGEDGSSE